MIMDPYKVLGVPRGADKETIEKAYKELAKKYHPDKYVNNPLASLAEEKMKEINEAYDMLKDKPGQQNGYSSSYSQSSYSGSGDFAQIRALINQGRIAEADAILDGIKVRNAEWNYLKGLCALNRGWYDRAVNYFSMAVNLDPNNMEYRMALNNLNSRVNTYRTYGNNGGYSSDSTCDCCSKLICADCCCECMGGDLISCC